MAIVNNGSRTLEEKGLMIKASDKVRSHNACIESIVLDGYVSLVESKLTAGDAAATCTRALTVLTADKIATAHNLSRALDIVTYATAGEAIAFKVGDSLEIGGAAAGIITEIIDNTNVRVDASGTIGAGAGSYQRPMFQKVFPGATIVLETGVLTSLVVESKTSNFAVVTTTSGTITSKDLVTYTNVESLIAWKEDNSLGNIYGIAMSAFTPAGSTYDATEATPIRVKTFGEFDKTLTTTADHATAGTVPETVHATVFGRFFHQDSTRNF